MEKHTVVAVDVAKAVVEVAVSKEPGRVSDRRRLSRGAFLVFLAQVSQATAVMEACGSAHYWDLTCPRRGSPDTGCHAAQARVP